MNASAQFAGWGFFLALIGTTVIVTRGDIVSTIIDISSALGTGELMMLGAVVSWSSYTILGRFSLNTLSPLVSTTYATCVGFLLLLIVTIFYHADTNTNMLSQIMTLKNTSAILYLGILGTVVGFVWFYQGVAAIGASPAAIFTILCSFWCGAKFYFTWRTCPSVDGDWGGDTGCWGYDY